MYKITHHSTRLRNIKPSVIRREVLSIMQNGVSKIEKDIISKFYNKSKRFSKGWKHRVFKIAQKGGRIELWNKYPFAVSEYDKTIKAKNGKLMAIPLAPALNKDGSKRFPNGPNSVARYKRGGSRELRPVTMNGNKFLVRVDKKNKVIGRPWFILKDEVTVKARTPGLTNFVKRGFKDINNQIVSKLADNLKGVK